MKREKGKFSKKREYKTIVLDHLPHICRVWLTWMPESISNGNNFFFFAIHTHTIRLLMFYSSPLMPSSEIDLFLNRNLLLFFTHTASHLHTYTMAISKEKKFVTIFEILWLCVCVEWNALLIRVYLCSNCLRVLTYVLFLCVFVVYTVYD